MNFSISSDVSDDLIIPILNLIHDSFREHFDRGLQFTCSNYQISDIKNKITGDGNKCFIAINDKGELIGISSVRINKDNKSAYECITAISPSAKGLGIGTALYEARKKYLIQMGCEYMLSDTSVDAVSSVNWHKKRCKCSIIGYRSFARTNYYSYVFREDFVDVGWFKKNIGYKFIFIKSFIITRIFYKKDGTQRHVYHILHTIRNIWK